MVHVYGSMPNKKGYYCVWTFFLGGGVHYQLFDSKSPGHQILADVYFCLRNATKGSSIKICHSNHLNSVITVNQSAPEDVDVQIRLNCGRGAQVKVVEIETKVH